MAFDLVGTEVSKAGMVGEHNVFFEKLEAQQLTNIVQHNLESRNHHPFSFVETLTRYSILFGTALGALAAWTIPRVLAYRLLACCVSMFGSLTLRHPLVICGSL